MGLDGSLALYDLQRNKRKMYKYDRVFGGDSTQEEVYEDTKALIRSVLDGESCHWTRGPKKKDWEHDFLFIFQTTTNGGPLGKTRKLTEGILRPA